MTLEQRLGDDMKAAMRGKDERRLSVVRMIRSQILLEKKKPNAPESIDDETVTRLVRGHAKKVREAMEIADKAGRPDLAADAKAELAIVESYLPAALADEEMETIVREAVRETGASGPSAMGAVMKQAMGRVAGRADGARVQAAVRRALGG
jgi:hypothetical protein